PWRDNVLIFTLDGGGDGICATVCIGNDGKFKRIAQTKTGNSIGNLYSRTTYLLGMKPWEHEWKVSGLAPYAPEEGTKKAYQVFKKFLTLPDDSLTFQNLTNVRSHDFYPLLRKRLEGIRFDMICGGVQRITEELITKWIKNAIKKTGNHKIVLGGGVFMNVKVNLAISKLKEVENMFVFPSCGDESLAIGAAYYVYKEKTQNKIPPLQEIYFGTEYSGEEIELSVSDEFEIEYHKDIEKVIGDLVADNEIVANFQGRMEWGARALGNRSILADPSDRDNIKKLNLMIKHRDWFMPYSPSILDIDADKYIENPKQIRAPYMIMAFDTKSKNIDDMIAAVHPYDLTARPQILEKEWNPRYYKIIERFRKRTGRGVILNTSFNLHGDPIVCSPQDAIYTFKKSDLKYLAMGNYLVIK
ncbi:hypothetical protein DRN58_01840, partial [Thermococci archaeon]